MRKFLPLFFLFAFLGCTTGRQSFSPQAKGNAALQSGPMLGYSDLRETLIWVQTKVPTTAQIAYRDKGGAGPFEFSPTIQTNIENSFIAKFALNPLEPGKNYEYKVYLGGQPIQLPYPTEFKTQQLWQFRTDPPAFTLATGSCAYINETAYDRPGKGYGSNYQIFTEINRQKPDVMLWLGDNVYLREADYFTKNGIIRRLTHDRATPELQPLLATANNYAIWDDHDFGPNDSDGTYVLKDDSRVIFDKFWGNPTCGRDGKGNYTRFNYNDVEFFLLDNRYFRTPNKCESCPERTMLGKEQLSWFLGALAASTAPFKVVALGGQLLTTNAGHETYFNLFPAERETILSFIEKEDIKGVLFMTGDRHFTELSSIKNKSGNMVYDLTISPLTSGAYADAARELNENRVEGTLVTKHNFATLKFSGPFKTRELLITVFDAQGNEIWTRTIGSDYSLK